MKVGWFHQHQIEALDPDDTPLEIIRRALPEASEAQRRSQLAQFGLGVDKAETTVANLSGGERARLLLNLVAMERAAPADPRRADQPPGHRQPPRPAGRAERLRGRGDPDHPRPLADGAGRRPAVAGRRRRRSKPFDGDMDDYAKFVLDRARAAARAPAKAAPGRPRRLAQRLGAAEAQARGRRGRARPRNRLLAEIDAALADPGSTKAPPAPSPTLPTPRPHRRPPGQGGGRLAGGGGSLRGVEGVRSANPATASSRSEWSEAQRSAGTQGPHSARASAAAERRVPVAWVPALRPARGQACGRDDAGVGGGFHTNCTSPR